MKIRLTIPEPCTEAWDVMTPTSAGCFCAHCQHTVTDFTDMTDRQIARYVRKNGVVCGRLRAGQLNRPLAETGRWFSVPKPWLGLFAAGVFGYLPAQAQTNPAGTPVVTLPYLAPKTLQEANVPPAEKYKPVTDSTTYSTVRVVDLHWKPVSGAYVLLGKAGPMLSTNQEGYFLLTKQQVLKLPTVTISYLGLQQTVVPVQSISPGESVIMMQYDNAQLTQEIYMGRMTITDKQKKGAPGLGTPSKKK